MVKATSVLATLIFTLSTASATWIPKIESRGDDTAKAPHKGDWMDHEWKGDWATTRSMDIIRDLKKAKIGVRSTDGPRITVMAETRAMVGTKAGRIVAIKTGTARTRIARMVKGRIRL